MQRLIAIAASALVTGIGTAAAGAAIADSLFPGARLRIRVAFVLFCGVLGLPAGGLVGASVVRKEE